ncbi:MAG: DUF6364 family protein [Steroidobacteraceae bacterium]
MQTKLTLRLEQQLILRAKRYARRSGKSLSELVADLFSRLNSGDEPPSRELTPAVRSLAGALSGRRPSSRADYRKHLDEKHR